MLAELRVRDLAVIADAHLELGPGLNVLTGETGAGKSLLVDALALLLGERAESQLVRPGAARAVVEGAFDVAGNRAFQATLEPLGVEAEDGRLVLKREVQASGRSRAWVNGSPATAATLRAVGELLVDLHGQHETQSLLRPDAQRTVLDSFADAEDAAAAVRTAFDEREAVAAEHAALEARHAEALRRADYLRHVAGEIERAAPVAGELEELEAEARRLAHAEELGRTAAELAALLDGDDRSAAGHLGHATRLMSALERIDPSAVAAWREMLEAALINVEELGRNVSDYAGGLDLDPARLSEVERRRDVLYQLERKHGPGLERVLETAASARRELDLLDTADSDLVELKRRHGEAEAAHLERCRALTAKRRAAAKRLGAAVSKHLAGLGMPDGSVRVALEPLERPGREGAERVEFMGTLNPGMGERPLARAASGGELSRLMLAFKLVLVKHDAVPSLVFDEVDQGIGGEVADRVAEALGGVAAEHQVLVITHLPQIAAAAARQVVVTKSAREGATITAVREVEGEERLDEVARMLGGAATTARRHAEQMLRKRAAVRLG